MKQLPQSMEAERAVIGALLLRPQGIERVDGLLEPDEFYHPQHRTIFRAALELHRAGKPIDVITIHEHLSGERGVDVMVLSGFADATPTLENIEYHCSIVREKAILRNLIITCEDIAHNTYEPELTAEEMVSVAMTKVETCFRSQPSTADAGSILSHFIKACEYRFKNPGDVKPLGVPTGFEQLDNFFAMAGLPLGHVTIVAAETSKGKSALAQAFIRHAVFTGYQTLDVTLEDVKEARVARHVAAISGIQNRQLQRQEVAADEWSTLMQTGSAIHDVASRFQFIDDRPSSVDELLARVRRHVQKHKTDLVVIDYLQRIPSGQPFHRKQDHVDYVFERIERFAGDHKETATVLVSQMARHEGRPQLRKLYHSAMLEQGAHTVLLIWAPQTQTSFHCRVVDVAKQKDGPIGLCVLGWEGRCVRFFNQDEVEIQHYLNAIGEAA